MLGWRRTFGIQSSPESFSSERSTKTFHFRWRLAKLFDVNFLGPLAPSPHDPADVAVHDVVRTS
jgi:hypothetical protein